MKDEISAAVTFLIKLISSNNPNLTSQQTSDLQTNLNDLLTIKFQNHWHPEKPTRGQAFRCIRLNGLSRNDSELDTACKRVGLSYTDLKFPAELTLWIDPEEVTARFGEHKGSYCILAKFKGGNKENFVNQININELEQKSMERARQATLEMMLSRKRKFNKNNYLKMNTTQVPTSYSNGIPFEMATGNVNGNMNSFYGSYYSSSPKYYSSSPPQANGSQSPVSHHGSTANHTATSTAQNNGMYSPSRMSPYRQNNSNTNINGSFNMNNKYNVRNFTSVAFSSNLMYENASSYQTDRYHWLNKSIVKA